ncbi:hypothetical protein, partial [Rhizobium johnstonii]|uniref:hypothetical protein n=1 Tax=Rhizobium johnstonii TaxID=3019933 RepID=UPI003F9A4701
YDVLRSHEPDHILLQATRQDASTGLLDIGRLGEQRIMSLARYRLASDFQHHRNGERRNMVESAVGDVAPDSPKHIA